MRTTKVSRICVASVAVVPQTVRGVSYVVYFIAVRIAAFVEQLTLFGSSFADRPEDDRRVPRARDSRQ